MAEWLVHGGRLAAARRAWPHAPGPWLDLSTGINPQPWPVARAGPIDWTRLPEPEATAALEAAAADAFGVSPERVCATPGSELALRLLALLDLPRPWRHVAPGYRTHAEALPGSVAVAPETVGALHDGTLLLARPSNPQGESWTVPADVTAVVDEAFADALAGPPSGNAVALRSFGKFYGLPGVRLGFVIAPPALLARLRARLGDWPVSAAAIAIGTAAYRDRTWQAATRDRLARDAAALDALLARHSLRGEGDCPLFRLVRTPDARALFDKLARAAILTRPFDHQPDWLRFGLPAGPTALDRLDRALGGG